MHNPYIASNNIFLLNSVSLCSYLQQIQSIGSTVKLANPFTFLLRLPFLTILSLAVLATNSAMTQAVPHGGTLATTRVTTIDCDNRDFMDDPLCESGFGSRPRLRGRWANDPNSNVLGSMTFFGSYEGVPISGDGLVSPIKEARRRCQRDARRDGRACLRSVNSVFNFEIKTSCPATWISGLNISINIRDFAFSYNFGTTRNACKGDVNRMRAVAIADCEDFEQEILTYCP